MEGQNNLNKEDFQNIVEHFPGSFVIMKPDIPKFTILEASGKYFKITNTTRDGIIGLGLFEAFPENPEQEEENSVKKLTQSLTKAITEKKAHKIASIKYDILDANSGKYEERFWQPIHQPILNKEGEVIFVMQYVEDVTEIKKLQESERTVKAELARQQDRLIKFFLQAPVAIAILTGPDIVVELANPSFCKLVGKDLGSLINRNLFDAVGENAGLGFEEILNKVFKTGETFRAFEYPGKLKKGQKEEKAFLNFVYEPITERDGTVSGVFAVAIDVTEQALLRKKIEENEQRLKLSLEASRLGVWEINLEDGKTLTDKRHDEIFGYTEAIPGWNYEKFLSHVITKDQDYVKKTYNEAGKSRKLFFECRIRTVDGLVRCIEVNGNFYRDKNGKEKLLGVVADITERKQLEKEKDEAICEARKYNEELEEVNQAKNKFISVISHDLRNPLASISSSSEIILRNLHSLKLPDIEKFVTIINKSSEKIVHHLHELVEWSKSNSPKIVFSPKKIELHQAVGSSIQILESASLHKRISIWNKIPENIFVMADQLMFSSIIQNLVSNAIKFTPEGGKVTIAAKIKNEAFAEIRVKDSGVGMPEEIRKNLFKEGKSVSTKGTEEEKGSGLGLKLVKEFVEKHGGKIWVESKPGEGTCFAFTVPRGS